jgi:hypothetical protein
MSWTTSNRRQMPTANVVSQYPIMAAPINPRLSPADKTLNIRSSAVTLVG